MFLRLLPRFEAWRCRAWRWSAWRWSESERRYFKARWQESRERGKWPYQTG